MKSSLIIILIFLFFAKSQDSQDERYQINIFIKYIQENGIWDVLCEIKRYFGPDICIEVYPIPSL